MFFVGKNTELRTLSVFLAPSSVKMTQIFKNSHHFQMRAPKIVVHAKCHPNQRNFFFDQSLAIFLHFFTFVRTKITKF